MVAGNTLTKAVVDTIFSQSSSLGSEYTGAWTSPTALVINVTNASRSKFEDTKVGTFILTVQEASVLKNADSTGYCVVVPEPGSCGHVGGPCERASYR